MIGIVLGYILGARAARAEIERSDSAPASSASTGAVERAMFDFEPTEEQQRPHRDRPPLRRERIIPIAAECDRESRFPSDVFEEAWKIGLVNPTLPRRVRRRRA